MVLGEDLDVEDYFFEDSSDDETSYIEEESDFYISPDDTDSLLKTYEESFDYGTDDASGFDESLEVYIQKVLQHEKDNPNVFSAGIISKEKRILTEKEYDKCMRELERRLLSDHMLDDTMKMINYCIILGPRSCLTYFNTGVLLRTLCDKVKKKHVPETLEILMRRFSNLPEDYRKFVLTMISHDINNIKSSAEIVKRFLTRLIMSLLENEKFEDSQYADNIIPLIHKIFLDLKNDPISIQKITSPKLVDGLLDLLESEVVGLRDKHTVIEILAIMACNSDIISQALMRKSAVRTLSQFNDEYHANPETIRMDIATLIWAILPPLEEQEFSNKCNLICENIGLPIWRKKSREGIWIPFTPSINFLIEQKYGRMMEQSFVESKTIHTVNYKKMQVTNEATLEKTEIIREYFGQYRIMDLKKCKDNFGIGQTVVSDCFARFAYIFFCSKLNFVHSNTAEEYICFQGLFTLFESVTEHQSAQLLAEEAEYLFGNSLLTRVQNLSIRENSDWKIIANHMVSRLISLNPQSYSIMDGRNENSIQSRGDEAEECIEIPRTRKVLEHNLKMSHHLENIFDTLMKIPNDIIENSSRRSLILSELLSYLTEHNSPTDRSSKLKEFLHVFANIQTHPQLENCNTSDSLFLLLLKKLKSFVWDSVGSYPNKCDEQTEHRTLKAASNTIGAIAEKFINISLHMDSAPTSSLICKLVVYPFTTIQWLEHHLLHQTSHDMREEDFVGDDASKVELFMNGQRIPSEITIYEAIHRFGNINGEKIFDIEHVIKLQKQTAGDGPVNQSHPFAHPLDRHLRERSYSNNIHEDLQKALQLIDILYGLNQYWTSLYTPQEHYYIVDPEEFIMVSLSNEADIYFEDPFGILLGKSPAWIEYLLENCPFMFNYSTRKMAFRVLRLDRRRSFETVIKKLYEIENQNFPNITIRRNNLLNDINAALRHSPSYSSWAIVFDDEVGGGVGPKRELFTLASRNLQKAELGMWSTSEVTEAGYVRVETGLYPMLNMEVNQPRNDDFTKSSLEEKFETVGLLLGKALIEEQILDLPLALPVFKWILKREVELTIDDLKYINPSVYKVLNYIQKMVEEREAKLSDPDVENRLSLVDSNDEIMAAYDLRFIVPGYDYIELIPGGADIQVTLKNARKYLDTIEQFFLKVGVETPMNALRKGLNRMINLDHLHIFQPEELQTMVCGEDADDYWSVGNLKEHIRVEDFRSHETAVIDRLFDIISSLSVQKRRLFLEFVTGSANLPVEGFGSLSPRLTIKRSEGSYPHAQTCFHTLYVPVDMSKSQLSQFIDLAITEGLGYFGLA